MVKIVILVILVGVIAFAPVYMLDSAIVPRLNGLTDVYGQAAGQAQQIADPAVDENATKLR